MNQKDVRPAERRRYRRSEVLATAAVFCAEQMYGTYLVHDMSAGGAMLVGNLALPPGHVVTLLLQFPGRSPLSINARVIRQFHGPHDRRSAVEFARLNAEEEDAIHEALLTALERQRARWAATVLVVDDNDDARDALERDLRALGHEAVSVPTPLEALAWLERPGGCISTAMIDVTPGPAQGLDVLEFLGEHHPEVRRVVMASEFRPFRLDLALRSGRAHQVLRKPWDRALLAGTLGPPEPRLRPLRRLGLD